jgi:transcription elongation GreA/GreB family factor
MNKITKDEILRTLNIEILKIRESARKTDEASKLLTGWSASGDKHHQQMAASLTDDYLERLSALKKEISETSDEISKTAQPVSLLKVVYDDAETLEFVLVQNAVSTPRFVFISQNSPLGKAVIDKAEGDAFSYSLGENGKNYSGRILSLE